MNSLVFALLSKETALANKTEADRPGRWPSRACGAVNVKERQHIVGRKAYVKVHSGSRRRRRHKTSGRGGSTPGGLCLQIPCSWLEGEEGR